MTMQRPPVFTIFSKFHPPPSSIRLSKHRCQWYTAILSAAWVAAVKAPLHDNFTSYRHTTHQARLKLPIYCSNNTGCPLEITKFWDQIFSSPLRFQTFVKLINLLSLKLRLSHHIMQCVGGQNNNCVIFVFSLNPQIFQLESTGRPMQRTGNLIFIIRPNFTEPEFSRWTCTLLNSPLSVR
jgi:hypothetical protein